jgi:putative transposase
LKIKLKLTQNQRKIVDEWITTSNYVYNKTVACINNGSPVNFQSLRDKLVTANTKKGNKEYQDITNNIKQLGNAKYELSKKIKTLQTNHKGIIIAKNANLMTSNQEQIKISIEQLSKLENTIKDEKIKLRTTAKQLKSAKNDTILEWELNTPKEVRAGAVNDVCKAYKTGYANLKSGNIKFFNVGFRKKTNVNKCVLIPKNFIKNKSGTIQIAPDFFKDGCYFKMGKKTIKKHLNLEINHDSRLVKQRNEYWLIVPIPVIIQEKTKPVNYCGIDPGVKTFLTVFGNNGCMEYKHNESLLKKLNDKIKMLKDKRQKKPTRISKRRITKVETRKENLINELHWKTINDILNTNDFIFYGNIKSHDIVKNGKNKVLNTNMNDLKFYKFKQRLEFKSIEKNKQLYKVNEAFTTQTCSFCGNKYKPGLSRVYECVNCKRKIGRDVNAAKNILMKGIQTNI